MLELDNKTNWQAGIYPGWSKDKSYQLTVVVKASYKFDVNGKLVLMEEQPEIEQCDQYSKKPLESSLRSVHEIAPYKHQSEIYLYGTAYPPHENITAMEVGMGLMFNDGHEWKKVLRIFGKRMWKKNMINYILSNPETITEPVSLSYENAFGGSHPENDEEFCETNPIGMGFNASTKQLINTELPEIEIGPNYLTSPVQRTIPAGYAPLAVNWEPRRSEIGKIESDPVLQDGYPYTDEAKSSLHNAAPVDQRFSQFFQGGEILHLRALLKDVPHNVTTQIILPELSYQLYTIINNEARLLSAVGDTVVVNTDEQMLSIIYRAAIPWKIEDRRQGWVVLKEKQCTNKANPETESTEELVIS